MDVENDDVVGNEMRSWDGSNGTSGPALTIRSCMCDAEDTTEGIIKQGEEIGRGNPPSVDCSSSSSSSSSSDPSRMTVSSSIRSDDGRESRRSAAARKFSRCPRCRGR